MTSTILILAFVAVALIALAYFKLQQEISLLLSAFRALIRNRSAPFGISKRLSLTLPLWRAAQKLNELRHLESRERQTASRVLSAGSRISHATSNRDQLFSELNNLLKDYLGQELTALSALTLIENNWTISFLDGLPPKRAGELLLDAVTDIAPQLETRRGLYVQPEKDSLCDFRVFGIGISLFLPLKSPDGTNGILWLGIARQALSLSAERRAFIQTIAEYAAASYYAAQKLWQREATAHREKDFLIGMSHDLRAPGTSALYAVRDLLSGELGNLTPEQHLRLNVIERSIDDQLSIVGDVLDFARHQRGLLEARKGSHSLHELCAPLCETFTLTATERGLKFTVHQLPDVSLNVDARHFSRMLTNLLSNAIKYSDVGEIQLTAELSDTNCRLSVIDQGIGIPENERALLFQEFKRCENSTARNGSGLGLSLTRALAELNGGSVQYQPNPENSGSIFSLELELAEIKQPLPEHQLASVLVVDDDEASRRTNMRYLSDYTTELIPAADSASALRLAIENNPELIVTDFHLQGHTALEFLEALHNRQICVPTVIVSGSGSDYFQNLPHNVRVLQKPIARAELKDAINELLAKN